MDPEVFQNGVKAQGREEGYRPSATVSGRGIMRRSVGDSDREVRRGNDPHLAGSVCLVSFLKKWRIYLLEDNKEQEGPQSIQSGFCFDIKSDYFERWDFIWMWWNAFGVSSAEEWHDPFHILKEWLGFLVKHQLQWLNVEVGGCSVSGGRQEGG